MSGLITAEAVQPGMTIRTRHLADRPSVTLTVAEGFWCDVDQWGNEVEPKDGHRPTHVVLGDAEGNDVTLPVTQLVHVVDTIPEPAWTPRGGRGYKPAPASTSRHNQAEAEAEWEARTERTNR